MKNNQKGFTYPLTLCLLILFLLFFSMNVERLLSERKLIHETETVLKQEYYYLSTVKKIEKIFASEGTLPAKGRIHYQEADMSYQADPAAGFSQKVSFTLHLNSGITVVGEGVFDTRTKKLMKWTELQ